MSKEGILSIMIQEHDDDTFKVRWEIWHEPCCKFTADSNSEKIVKIGQHFTKLWTNIVWHVFRAKGVETMCPRSGHLCPRSSQSCPLSNRFAGSRELPQLEPLDRFSRLWLKWRVLTQKMTRLDTRCGGKYVLVTYKRSAIASTDVLNSVTQICF